MKRKNERIITYQKIEEYGQWLENCERSSETVKKYGYYLKQFKEFIGDGLVTKEAVLLWKARLRERVTPVTINCVTAALNGFFRYCGWDGCESKFLKISRSSFYPEQKELTKSEYERLVKTAIRKGQAEIECKGRIRTVLLTRQLCMLLNAYSLKKNICTGMIFVTKSGRALDRSNIWREMKALGQEADVKVEKIFPHNLRHLFARTYYEIEKNLSKLADILGHRDINTTRIYTKESGSQHRLQLEKMKLLLHDTTEYFFCCTLGYS